MSRIQSGKNRNPEKPVSGCLGRMVNLFDLNTAIGVNKLLTDKPHHDGSSFPRRHSDVSITSVLDDQMDDKLTICGLKKSPSNRKSNCTPIKMLIAQEMSKEDNCKQSPSNLVAKLMGLDNLPRQHQPDSVSRRSQSGSLEFLQQENGFLDPQVKHEEYKDVYEYVKRENSPKKGKIHEKQKMDLVREKFMEAKRLSTDENLRQSKQFQDALEVLSSNKDLFLEFLQEPNSLFSQNLYNFQSVPPPDSRRITVLRPSKLVENHKKNPHFLFSQECFKIDDNIDENPTQHTRIVVLKPSSNIKNVSSHDDVIDCDLENIQEIKNEVSDNLSELRRDETLISSVFSNGYIGDDSSYCKSEIDYTNGNLSDSEIVSPISRHSWDYINRFSSHYSASSSYSPESTVFREAKKRLSERWMIMANNNNKNVLEQREIQRSSNTLGDMLALSDMKKSETIQENQENVEKNLFRSKSLQESNNVMKEKEKLVKSSSFKGKVSSLFFSKNKKLIKDKSDPCKDVSCPPRNVVNEGSKWINDAIIEEASCSGSIPMAEFSFTKSGISGNPSENQDQPSPISVLEPQFEEDDHATECNPNSKLNEHGIESMKYNLIDKSPPIGSIARTLSWDDSVGSSTPYTGRPAPAPVNPEQEEQECLFYIQTLLSSSNLNNTRSHSFLGKWHSPESPLDPSLRDKYTNLTEKTCPIGPLTVQLKQRHQNAITKLVFDCVNDALVDIAGRGPCSGAHGCMDDMAVIDRVWAHVKEWFSGEESGGWEEVDGGVVVVERVVNKEVVGRGWVEGLRVESENIRKEIERKLLEELVSECVLELTGRC